jgi:hypothetical protein
MKLSELMPNITLSSWEEFLEDNQYNGDSTPLIESQYQIALASLLDKIKDDIFTNNLSQP